MLSRRGASKARGMRGCLALAALRVPTRSNKNQGCPDKNGTERTSSTTLAATLAYGQSH
eukprot:XP_001701997.1 predicted protein [Chlamydomonas reinhardtii]